MTSDTKEAKAGEVPLYRKTALVQASQWFKHGDHPAVERLPANRALEGCAYDAACGWIDTLEGGLTVTPGDWIAGPGAKGEYWPIKPDVFASTYEVATPQQAKGEQPMRSMESCEWHDFGKLGGRNVSRCLVHNTLAWTGEEQCIKALASRLAGQGEQPARRPGAFADRIAFESAMLAGKGCDVWPSEGDYTKRTGREVIALYAGGEQPAPAADEREAFEAWCVRTFGEHANLFTTGDNNIAWVVWQARASAPAPAGDAPQQWRERVAAAMDQAWDDWCTDTNTFPDDFTLHSGRRLSFKAGMWAWNVADLLLAASPTVPGDAPPDAICLEWLENECPKIDRAGDTVYLRAGEHLLGVGPNIRAAVRNAMMGDGV